MEPDEPSSRRFPSHPLVGVAAVVFRAGRVLLVRRANPPRQGEWSLPGGAQRLGETVAAAIRREVLEETQVEAAVVGVIDVVDLIEVDDADGRISYHYTLIEMAAAWRGGEAVAGEDAADAAWFDLDQVRSLGLWSETERIIDLAHRKWTEAGCP